MRDLSWKQQGQRCIALEVERGQRATASHENTGAMRKKGIEEGGKEPVGGRMKMTVTQSPSRQSAGRSHHGWSRRGRIYHPQRPLKANPMPPGRSSALASVYLTSNPCHPITNRAKPDGPVYLQMPVGDIPPPSCIYTSPRLEGLRKPWWPPRTELPRWEPLGYMRGFGGTQTSLFFKNLICVR